MTGFSLLVTLASTLAWASFDAVRKGLVRKIDVAQLSLWVSLAQIPGYLVWAIGEGRFTVQTGYFLPWAVSVSLNLVSNLAFLEAVRIAPLSLTIPMLSFTPVFVAVASGPLLHERLVLGQWIGISLVTFGAFWLSRARPAGEETRSVFASFFGQRGVRLMLWVALFWALTPLADKMALRHAGVGMHGILLSSGVALGMVIYLAARGRIGTIRVERDALGLLSLGGLTNVLALGLQFVAISSLSVSLFEAVKRALGLLLAILSGRVFFGEKIQVKKVGAACVMAAGVVLVLVS